MDGMQKYKKIENATSFNQQDVMKIGLVMMFFVATSAIALFFGAPQQNQVLLIFAAVVGAYMALNIGANDVANNMGPAVGSHAITLFGAIVIAAIAESAGAIIAGKDVVDTIKSGIVSPDALSEVNVFVVVMLAALVSSALWVHLATFIGAPVSTTHSLVGGVMGAGVAAGWMVGGFSEGLEVVNWGVIGSIAASWVISPVMGGLIAAALLWIIKRSITYHADKKIAAKRVVPILIFVMIWCFFIYMVQKTGIIQVDFVTLLFVSFFVALAAYFISVPLIRRKVNVITNTKEGVNELFTIPLIFSAAMLSFAHGANDVANAIGPVAGIYEAISGSDSGGKAHVPFWILLIGGLGLSIGLALYGPKLIRTVGSEITELDKMRAFCVALSAAVTVLVASQLGLPVSSTHIAIGAIFGVGFLREYLKSRYLDMQQEIIEAHKDNDAEAVQKFLNEFHKASVKKKKLMLQSLKEISAEAKRKKLEEKGVITTPDAQKPVSAKPEKAAKPFVVRFRKEALNPKVQGLYSDLPQLKKKERKSLKKMYKRELVRRSAIKKIVASWLITVPLSAIFGALVYLVIDFIGVAI